MIKYIRWRKNRLKTTKWFLICSIAFTLFLASCGANTPSTVSGTPTSTSSLNDDVVKKIDVATQSGDFQNPLDATPDVDGTTIYFTAHNSHGAGVFKVPASGGVATEVFVGNPFVSARGISISSDGKTLYVADPKADQIFTLAVTGGSPSQLQGSKGTAPQNLNVVSQSGQDVLYFTGIEPTSRQVAVLKLSTKGADAATVIVKGSPLVAPDGVVVTQAGIVYVSDRSTSGTGKIFKIDGNNVTVLLDQVRLGNPAGIAFSPDESTLLVSALQANSHDEVLLVDLSTGKTGSVTKVVGQNVSDSGGLHASRGNKGIYAWAGVTGGVAGSGAGTVFQVKL